MKRNFLVGAVLCVTLHLSLAGANNASAQTIKSSDVQAIAIYKSVAEGYGSLAPGSVNFNVTQPTLIDSLISAIDFSVPRDASDLLSLPNAYVYVKFKDNSVGVYELFDVWAHMCKRRNPGRSYYISQNGRKLFEAHAQ
jgi:hypothetical protein